MIAHDACLVDLSNYSQSRWHWILHMCFRSVLESSKQPSAYLNAVETSKERHVLQLILEQLRVRRVVLQES